MLVLMEEYYQKMDESETKRYEDMAKVAAANTLDNLKDMPSEEVAEFR